MQLRMAPALSTDASGLDWVGTVGAGRWQALSTQMEGVPLWARRRRGARSCIRAAMRRRARTGSRVSMWWRPSGAEGAPSANAPSALTSHASATAVEHNQGTPRQAEVRPQIRYDCFARWQCAAVVLARAARGGGGTGSWARPCCVRPSGRPLRCCCCSSRACWPSALCCTTVAERGCVQLKHHGCCWLVLVLVHHEQLHRGVYVSCEPSPGRQLTLESKAPQLPWGLDL